MKVTARPPIFGKALAEQTATDDLFAESPLMREARRVGIDAAEYIDGSGELDEDELRADLARRKRIAGKPITCRACELPRPAAVPGVLLCAGCAADPAATRAHLLDIDARAQTTWENACAAFVAALAQADDATAARWDVVQAKLAACHGAPDPVLARRLDATRALGDDLAAILRADDAIRAAAAMAAQAARRRNQGCAELDALEETP